MALIAPARGIPNRTDSLVFLEGLINLSCSLYSQPLRTKEHSRRGRPRRWLERLACSENKNMIIKLNRTRFERLVVRLFPPTRCIHISMFTLLLMTTTVSAIAFVRIRISIECVTLSKKKNLYPDARLWP